MATIDVSRHVSEMEVVLRSQAGTVRRREALAVLERWQWDEMVDRPSQLRARQLVREFGSASGREMSIGFWSPPSLRDPARAALRPKPNVVVLPLESAAETRADDAAHGDD